MLANDEVAPAFAGVTVGADGSVTATDAYFYKPGRPGGQTANFGSNAGDDGTLQANPIDPDNNVITIRGNVSISLTAKTNTTPAFTLNLAGAVLTSTFEVIRIVMPTQTNNRITFLRAFQTVLKTGGGVPFVLFDVSPVFQFQAAQAAGQVFFYAPSFGDDGSVRTVSVNTRLLLCQPNYRALTGGSTGTASAFTLAEVAPVVDASWNAMASVKFILFGNPTGTHAVGVTDYIGIDVPDTITKPTNVYTIRNLEDRAKMVHRGAAVFGDLGTTVPAAGIELEVRSTIGVFVAPRMTNAQVAALPAVPDGSQIYCTDVGALAIGMHQMIGGVWQAM